MTANTFFLTIKKLLKLSKKLKTRIVFSVGIATNIWGRPRLTYDIDGIIKIEDKKIPLFLSVLSKNGFSYDKKNPIKIIHGLPLLTLKYKEIFIDLFISRNEYQNQIFERMKFIKYQRIKLPTISPEDLVLLKLMSGRTRDLDDVRDIIKFQRNLNFKYLKKWAKKLNIFSILKMKLKV